MPDLWEYQFGLNPYNPGDALIDTDSDGLTNLEEYWAGRNPVDSSDNQWESPIPIAHAGKDFLAPLEGPVILDGSESYAPDGDALIYQWTQIAGPAVALTDGSSPMPQFLPPKTGTYTFQLVVRDGQYQSSPAHVTAQVVDALPQFGDVYPRGAPDGIFNADDLNLIALFHMGVLIPTEDEKQKIDIVPFKILDNSTIPIGILLQPDGAFNQMDVVILNILEKYQVYFNVIGWEIAGP
jgi:hypothetical protein